MDGNRKWARSKGLTVKEGHTIGAENLKHIALACKNVGVKYLTTYAFSVENWKRSEEEVKNLIGIIMNMFSGL